MTWEVAFINEKIDACTLGKQQYVLQPGYFPIKSMALNMPYYWHLPDWLKKKEPGSESESKRFYVFVFFF